VRIEIAKGMAPRGNAVVAENAPALIGGHLVSTHVDLAIR
jgi:hypothetical protein